MKQSNKDVSCILIFGSSSPRNDNSKFKNCGQGCNLTYEGVKYENKDVFFYSIRKTVYNKVISLMLVFNSLYTLCRHELATFYTVTFS